MTPCARSRAPRAHLRGPRPAAIRPARTALYGDDDPFVVNLSRFAQERGYRRLVLVSPNVLTFDKIAAGRFERECAARKVELTILEDAYVRRSRYGQTFRGLSEW